MLPIVNTPTPVKVPCCSDWDKQIEIVNGPIVLQTIRSGGKYKYDGIPFRYCPWCGKKRG